MGDVVLVETDKKCNVCTDEPVQFVLTPDKKHYGKFVCGKCNRFITWAKSPKTSTELRERQETIAKMLSETRHSVDDVKFLCRLYNKVHMPAFDQPRLARLTGQ